MESSRRKKVAGWVWLLALVVVLGLVWWATRGDGPPGTGGPALDKLTQLRVAPEDTGHPYDRDEWPHWAGDGKGCDTRELALQRQGAEVRTDGECRARSGRWVSPYDDEVVTDAADTDVDHVVPLAEANRSGTRGWTREQRRAFANDLDQLLVVTARSNRQKGDQDPARWLPEPPYHCDYAARWVDIKLKYRMTVDQAEHDALASVLRRCPA